MARTALTSLTIVWLVALASAQQSDWRSYGLDYYEQRFSPLDQITDANVDKLGLAWQFETMTERGLQATRARPA